MSQINKAVTEHAAVRSSSDVADRIQTTFFPTLSKAVLSFFFVSSQTVYLSLKTPVTSTIAADLFVSDLLSLLALFVAVNSPSTSCPTSLGEQTVH